MKLNNVLKVLVSACIFLASSVNAEVLMKYQKIPLNIELNTKDERIIFIDKTMQIGIPGSLNNKLRVQSVTGAIYLKALTDFNTTRLQLRDIETGEIMLVDVSAKSNRKNVSEHIRVTFDEIKNTDNKIPAVKNNDIFVSRKTSQRLPAPIALIRYASQHLYAPKHAIEALNGVHRISLNLPNNVTSLFPNIDVTVTPLESFALNGYVVTSFKVENNSSTAIKLSPHLLQGNFNSISFQHLTLSPKNTIEDNTALYVVTQGSINSALVENENETK